MSKLSGKRAFEKIMREYEKYIYNISYRMMCNSEDAKDVSQEALIKIYRNIDKCADMSAIKSWITRVVTNTCIDFLRRRKPELSFESEFETDDGRIELQLPSDEPTPEEHLIYKEIRSEISDALGKLPDTYRLLIIMRDIYGLSYHEISLSTGTQLGTVKSRLSRARNNLRLLLKGGEQKDNPNV